MGKKRQRKIKSIDTGKLDTPFRALIEVLEKDKQDFSELVKQSMLACYTCDVRFSQKLRKELLMNQWNYYGEIIVDAAEKKKMIEKRLQKEFKISYEDLMSIKK